MTETMPVQLLERKERNTYSSSRPAKETTFREWVVTNQIGTDTLQRYDNQTTRHSESRYDSVTQIPNAFCNRLLQFLQESP